jgi:hypothetical protein
MEGEDEGVDNLMSNARSMYIQGITIDNVVAHTLEATAHGYESSFVFDEATDTVAVFKRITMDSITYTKMAKVCASSARTKAVFQRIQLHLSFFRLTLLSPCSILLALNWPLSLKKNMNSIALLTARSANIQRMGTRSWPSSRPSSCCT